MQNAIASRKKYYVYTLAYPDGHVFYVGKGTGRRVYEHEAKARGRDDSRRSEIIREIWKSGGKVKTSLIYETDSEEEALNYERASIKLMNADGSLANIRDGNRHLKKSPMTIGSLPITVDNETYLTATEAARRLKVSRETFNKNVSVYLGKYKFGALRRIYYRESEVNQFTMPQQVDGEQ